MKRKELRNIYVVYFEHRIFAFDSRWILNHSNQLFSCTSLNSGTGVSNDNNSMKFRNVSNNTNTTDTSVGYPNGCWCYRNGIVIHIQYSLRFAALGATILDAMQSSH